MAAGELQRLADDSETEATQRYTRQHVLAVAVEDALRRADAMWRLEVSLRLGVREHTR